MSTANINPTIARYRSILSQAGWAAFTQSEKERLLPLIRKVERRDMERYRFVLRNGRVRRELIAQQSPGADREAGA